MRTRTKIIQPESKLPFSISYLKSFWLFDVLLFGFFGAADKTMVMHSGQTPNLLLRNLCWYLYIIRCLSLKYRLIYLRVLKVTDELLGEPNKERRVKCQPVFQKKAPNDIFIVKFKKFTIRVIKLELKSNRKN